MPQPLEASMPQFLDLADGYTIRLTAVDPTTGVFVAGVNVQDASIYGRALVSGGGGGEPGGGGTYEFGPWLLVSGPGT